jgi:twitching motility two-component system response regulator PilG
MGALVMVIDDSGTVRKILSASLQRAGFQAAVFRDGIEAMKALSSGDLPLPDAIVIDVQLPKMDGYELVRRFRARRPFATLPIIMLSGHDGWFDKLRGRWAGATVYLTKPFQPEQIITRLHRYLDGDDGSHAGSSDPDRWTGPDTFPYRTGLRANR